MNKKWCIYWCDDGYYGLNAHWSQYHDTFTFQNNDFRNLDKEGNVIYCKEDIVMMMKKLFTYNDDYQKDYLPASEVMNFIERLESYNGDEYYDNLCKNLDYLSEIETKINQLVIHHLLREYREKAYAIAKDGYSNDTCCLRPFDIALPNLLNKNELFISLYKSKMQQIVPDLYNVIYNFGNGNKVFIEELNRRNSTLKNDISKLKEYIRNKEKQISENNKTISELSKKA